MVGAELALDAIISLGIVLDSHDTGVVEQDIDLADAGIDLGGGLADRLLVAEFERDVLCLDVGVGLLDLLEDWGNLAFATAGEDDLLGVRCRQCESGLGTQTAFAGTGDQDDLAISLSGEGLDNLLAGGSA